MQITETLLEGESPTLKLLPTIAKIWQAIDENQKSHPLPVVIFEAMNSLNPRLMKNHFLLDHPQKLRYIQLP